jgi:Kef-type K+ transport system membrane component KefB
MENFLYQATIYLAAAVIAVPISARLGLGSVLGYLAAGIIIGPVLGLVGAEMLAPEVIVLQRPFHMGAKRFVT